jgi:hypothetical protein
VGKKTNALKKELGLGMGAIFLLVAAAWIWRAPDSRVPRDLVGEWHTNDPSYLDRWFEIDPVAIHFVTGEGQVSTGFIKAVKSNSENRKTLYTISYSVDGSPNEVSFYFEVNKVQMIRFTHQEKTVWTKSKSLGL